MPSSVVWVMDTASGWARCSSPQPQASWSINSGVSFPFGVATGSSLNPPTLSGGERNRVHLAKLLRSGGNLLLLDEPTNDLDVDTLRALEEALLAFAGCAVVISHDRWFLDRVATHVLAFEGDSQVEWFEGNFEAYEESRRSRLGAEAEQPHRIAYKRLVSRA